MTLIESWMGRPLLERHERQLIPTMTAPAPAFGPSTSLTRGAGHVAEIYIAEDVQGCGFNLVANRCTMTLCLVRHLAAEQPTRPARAHEWHPLHRGSKGEKRFHLARWLSTNSPSSRESRIMVCPSPRTTPRYPCLRSASCKSKRGKPRLPS